MPCSHMPVASNNLCRFSVLLKTENFSGMLGTQVQSKLVLKLNPSCRAGEGPAASHCKDAQVLEASP